jgi:oxygen-independent coproporphyrinogen-3 oxidase
MDHFALATDSLAVAAREHALHRNFMGYTTHPAPDSVGFGVSAIGDVGGALAQNTKKLNRYHDAIAAGRFAVERGFERSPDDRVRGDVIHEIMCNFYVDTRAVERAHGIDFAVYFAGELRALDGELTADGIVRRSAHAIEVTEAGRALVRNVAMVFDAYLPKHEGPRPVFSRTI